MDNDSNGRTNLEPLPCGECGQLVAEVGDDTRIGISRIDGTPAALCSEDCARDNARRVLEAPTRCRCGAVVDLDQELLTRRGQVLGCEACRWSGSPLRYPCAACHHIGPILGCFCAVAGCECPADSRDLHYLAESGGSLCGSPVAREGRTITTTTNRDHVGCLVCIGLIDLAPMILDIGARRGVS